jgi:hypothetical protein
VLRGLYRRRSVYHRLGTHRHSLRSPVLGTRIITRRSAPESMPSQSKGARIGDRAFHLVNPSSPCSAERLKTMSSESMDSIGPVATGVHGPDVPGARLGARVFLSVTILSGSEGTGKSILPLKRRRWRQRRTTVCSVPSS